MEETKNTEDKKFCTGCRTFKPFTDFYKDKRSRDGYHYICKECSKERVKKSLEKTKNQKLQEKIAEARQEVQKKDVVSTLTPRELMEELMRQGYEGDLHITLTLSLRNGVITSTHKKLGI